MLDISVWKKLKRGPQVVLLKDAAIISAFTGLQSGDLVVDVGAGSGWLAVYLGSIVAPSGKVYSYEKRPEFAKLARKNVEKSGLGDVVEVKEKDAQQGIEERNVELVTLDLADAPFLLEHAYCCLKPKGFCVGYLPHAEQVQAFVRKGLSTGFRQEQTVEVMARPFLVREQGFRPENTGLLHTAYLSFLRKPI